jgi:NDP-sugar pyrophosphorylase family protein
MDIGKPQEYLEINRVLLEALNKQVIPQNNKYEVKKPVAFDANVVVGEKSEIGPYAILGKNVRIGKKTKICNSVIFPDTQVGDYTVLNGAIIGEGAYLGDHVICGKGCIVADQAKIKNGVHLSVGHTVCPAKEILENF